MVRSSTRTHGAVAKARAAEWIAVNGCPDACLVANDIMAVGVLEALDASVSVAPLGSDEILFARSDWLDKNKDKADILVAEFVKLWGEMQKNPGINLVYAHLNRAITARHLDMIYVMGPGHGGPGPVAAAWQYSVSSPPPWSSHTVPPLKT